MARPDGWVHVVTWMGWTVAGVGGRLKLNMSLLNYNIDNIGDCAIHYGSESERCPASICGSDNRRF